MPDELEADSIIGKLEDKVAALEGLLGECEIAIRNVVEAAETDGLRKLADAITDAENLHNKQLRGKY